MRDLKRGPLLLCMILALLIILAFSNAGNAVADTSRRAFFQASSVELSISVDPVNVQPGEHATVTISIKNHSSMPLAPEVRISLPTTISARMRELPAGTYYNTQTQVLTWQPIIPGNGSEIQLTLPVVALVGDAQATEQTIGVVLQAEGEEISHDTKFWIGLSPRASIRTNPPQVAVGQPIQLEGTVTGPGPVDQLWSLGDGRIVEAENPIVLYPLPGTYELIFQASTPMGVVSAKAPITIVAQPIARFSVSDSTPSAGVQVNFSNESGGQQPLTNLWDFGDGTISTDQNPEHAFGLPGTYRVRLFVSGNGGQSESVQTVTVGPMPVADFVIADVIEAGAVVQGQAFADETATSVTWDMGDGNRYEGLEVNHVFWSAGDYPITVTVTNEYGELRMQRNIRVNAGKHFLFLPLVTSNTGEDLLATSEVPVVQEDSQVEDELPLLDLPADLSPQEQMLAYINEARRLNGLGALNLVPELSAAAQVHADDMALNGFAGHVGSDGSVPALRLQLAGYSGGYAGEATAWGMSHAVEPVRYWLASPDHRVILLNPVARDVGVGFGENFEAPSVWYWTAEFASMDLPVVNVTLPASTEPEPEPVLSLLGPPSNAEFTLTQDADLIFTWSWPVALSSDERFAIYLNSQGRTTQIGTVSQPQDADQYQFKTAAVNVPAPPGQHLWFIQLEDTLSGDMREQSEARPIFFVSPP